MSKTLGQIGYEAYLVAEKPGLTFDGRPMPTLEHLAYSEAGLVTQRRQEAAAKAIADQVRSELDVNVSHLIVIAIGHLKSRRCMTAEDYLLEAIKVLEAWRK